jgi:hypothetical protein
VVIERGYVDDGKLTQSSSMPRSTCLSMTHP